MTSTKKKKVHKIFVDRAACIAAETCVVEAPEAFEMDRENIAIVRKNGEAVSDEKLIIAAQSCPTQAIILYDENGEQIFPKL